jgi:hypothetical protein
MIEDLPTRIAISTVFGAREENRTPDLLITSQAIGLVGTGRAWYQAIFGSSLTPGTTSYRAMHRRMWTDCGLRQVDRSTSMTQRSATHPTVGVPVETSPPTRRSARWSSSRSDGTRRCPHAGVIADRRSGHARLRRGRLWDGRNGIELSGGWNNEESLIGRARKRSNRILMAAQCLKNVQRGHVAEPQPNNLRGRPVQKRELPKIRVLRHDDQPLDRRVLPDLDIGGRVETNAGHVLATRELVREQTDKVSGQVLVEQQPHAGVASRRSRIAANSIAARTWSAVNSGKSVTISSTVMPDAR